MQTCVLEGSHAHVFVCTRVCKHVRTARTVHAYSIPRRLWPVLGRMNLGIINMHGSVFSGYSYRYSYASDGV